MQIDNTEEIKQIVNENKSFMITSHVYPDCDSVGSSLALYHALRQMGKEALVMIPHSVGDKFNYLPGADEMNFFPHGKDEHFDVVFVLDAGSLTRTRGVRPLVEACEIVVNIDHHISNEKFGQAIIIDPEASSTAEILFKLLSAWGVKITPEIAECLYAGVVTDTGRFSYDNTDSGTLRMAADLIDFGADPSRLFKNIYLEKTLGELKLLSCALASLKVSENGKYAWIELSARDFEETGTQPVDTSDFAEIPRSVIGVEVGMFFREEGPENFKGSLRSNSPSFNVSNIARTFGGGGHAQAAGFTIFEDIATARKKVLNEIENHFKG